ncbi:hypothetical protein D3C76_296280 [compost metagenome]
MNVKGSLGRLRTWLWLVFGGAVLTVFNYTLENSEPPKWVYKLLGASGAAFDAFATKAVPLWSVLVIGLLLSLIAIAATLILSIRLYRANKAITSLNTATQELRLSQDTLEQTNNELSSQRTALSQDLANTRKALKEAQEERDSTRHKLDRITSNAKKVDFTLEGLASAGAFRTPRESNLPPKTSKLFSLNEISAKNKAEVLKAVMLLTKTELFAARAAQIDDLVGLGKHEVEKYAHSLLSDGYLTRSNSGLQAAYKLTAKANMHFKCVENNIPSELQFNQAL